MPRVVYGVLDVHRSHRIEVPNAARDAAAGRPTACALCHVDRDRAVPDALFAGDPVARAVAADALGRAPFIAAAAPPEAARARRAGLLLEVMARDRYPAIRHLAWRALRRLSPGAAEDFDPAETAAPARQAAVARVAGQLGASASPPDQDVVAGLRTRARDADLEMGE